MKLVMSACDKLGSDACTGYFKQWQIQYHKGNIFFCPKGSTPKRVREGGEH